MRLRFLLLSLCLAVAVSSAAKAAPTTAKQYTPFPQPDSGYVTDIASLLSADEQEKLEHWLLRAEKRTGVEMVVVTINSLGDYPGTPNGSIESFAGGLFNRWGVGNLPKNDGVMLLVSVRDRKARIELGSGYGKSRDAQSARIMNEVIVPYFKRGDYAGGIDAGVREMMQEFAGVRVGWNWPLIVGSAAIPVLAAVAFSLFRSGNRGWGWVCAGLLLIVVLAVVFVIVRASRLFSSEGNSDSWSPGGFGGGFGGGSSGGGGATGSW